MVTSRAPAQPVVVGVDDTPHALVAAAWAGQEAVVHRAPLRVVHAVARFSIGLVRPDADGAAEALLVLHRQSEVVSYLLLPFLTCFSHCFLSSRAHRHTGPCAASTVNVLSLSLYSPCCSRAASY